MSRVKESQVDYFEDVYDDDDDSMSNKYLTFLVGDESYGIAIRYILEIIELQKITEVPDMPDYVKGVINLRGKIIPTIDLRLRFKMNERAYDDRTCIIVTDIDSKAIGFIVDTVSEVVDIEEENISPAPDFKSETHRNRYIEGLGKFGNEVKIILDVQKVLRDEDKATITSASGSE